MSAAWMGRALTAEPATGSKCLCQGSCGGICSLSEQGYTLDSLQVPSPVLGHMQENRVPSRQCAGERRGLGKAPEDVCSCASVLNDPALEAAQPWVWVNAEAGSPTWCWWDGIHHPQPHGALLWVWLRLTPPSRHLSQVIPADKKGDVCSDIRCWEGWEGVEEEAGRALGMGIMLDAGC